MTDLINPYESSKSAEEPVAVQKSSELGTRHYNARLDWSDRQALLRSLAPGRVALAVWAILRGLDLYAYMTACITWFSSDKAIWDLLNIAIAGNGLLYVVQVLLMLYLFWLEWQCIDRIQEVAAGNTPSFNRWSQLHLRSEKLAAIAAAFAIFSEVVRIAIDRGTSLAASGLGPS
jgi:hypothetical protein